MKNLIYIQFSSNPLHYPKQDAVKDLFAPLYGRNFIAVRSLFNLTLIQPPG